MARGVEDRNQRPHPSGGAGPRSEPEQLAQVSHVRIAAASAALRLHPQTLRKYERAGLLRPGRSGSSRRYTDADFARLALIKHLAEVRGINVAGMAFALAVHDQITLLLEELSGLGLDDPGGLAQRRLRDLLASFLRAD